MSKVPDNVTLVRIDKEIYNNFRDYCDENGLVPPKHIGFILRDFLKAKDWVELITKKSQDANVSEEVIEDE